MIDSLARQHQHLIHRCIRRYAKLDPALLSEQDLQQEAYAAICDAISTWNPCKGGRFEQYLQFHLQKRFTKTAGEKHYDVVLRYADGTTVTIPYSQWRKKKARLRTQVVEARLQRRSITRDFA
ncbi:MAG: hypothetical protein D6690_17945 [Nitrospirae bacterium]|nr:MAG: hypothetical protein D6690_17945 [Nitrospirota bacterium]